MGIIQMIVPILFVIIFAIPSFFWIYTRMVSTYPASPYVRFINALIAGYVPFTVCWIPASVFILYDLLESLPSGLRELIKGFEDALFFLAWLALLLVGLVLCNEFLLALHKKPFITSSIWYICGIISYYLLLPWSLAISLSGLPNPVFFAMAPIYIFLIIPLVWGYAHTRYIHPIIRIINTSLAQLVPIIPIADFISKLIGKEVALDDSLYMRFSTGDPKLYFFILALLPFTQIIICNEYVLSFRKKPLVQSSLWYICGICSYYIILPVCGLIMYEFIT